MNLPLPYARGKSYDCQLLDRGRDRRRWVGSPRIWPQLVRHDEPEREERRMPVNERFRREINIQTLDDLENYIWEEIGSCDMEEVRRIVDLFRKYGYLLEAD